MVIGRSGCVIRELQTKTKCKIQIPSQASPGQPNRIVTVSGSPDGCQQVKQMMERIIIDQSSQSVMSGAGFNQQNFQHGGQPHGMFQGVTMNQYGQPQGAYGQQYGHQHPNYGQQQQYGSAYAGQQANAYGQAAGHAGQQKTDYSAEWAAYYAAQAAAQQPTTSSSVTSQAPAPAASSSGADASQQSQAVPTDPTAYYDDFWRYVSYYGEEAARTYYGAWSPSVGTPNPNDGRGSTMNASQSQATTDLGTTTQGSGNISSPGQSQAARDTSVRNVSNLPAWMTKGQS